MAYPPAPIPADSRARDFFRFSRRFASAAMMAAMAAGLFAPQSYAANRTWKESVNGFFNNPDNWNPAFVPGASDTLRFQLASGGYTVTLTENASVQDIDFYTDITTINLGSSKLDTITLRMARNANDEAVMYLRSGLLEVSGGVQLAQGSNSKATLDIGEGATLDWAGASAAFNVGNVGEAVVRIHSGGKLFTRTRPVTVGLSGSSGSSVRIAGAGSAWTHTGSSFIVGAGTSSSILIADQGKLEINASSGNIVLGSGSAAAEGKVHVTGSGSRMSTETLEANFTHIGQTGAGRLVIEDGASYEHTGGKMILADGAESEGSVTVSGAGSSFTARSSIDIGGAGEAHFTVSEAATALVEGNVAVGTSGVLSLLGGQMTIDGNLSMLTGSKLEIRLEELIESPLLQVGSNLSLMDEEVALSITLGDSFSFGIGERYDILGYTGLLDGLFEGLQEGAWLNVGTHTFQINYGTGVDGVISLTAIPEPGALGLILLGAASGIILRKRTTIQLT